MSQLFTWGGQSIGVSARASFPPKKSQGWSSEWTGWISLQSKGLSRVFSKTTVQKHQFFGTQPSSQSNSHIHTWPLGETIALTRRTLVSKVMSLLLNTLSRLVITFLPGIAIGFHTQRYRISLIWMLHKFLYVTTTIFSKMYIFLNPCLLHCCNH